MQCFHSPVTLGGLQVHTGGVLQVEGSDLRVQSMLHGVSGDAARPMLRVARFQFHISLLDLLRPRPTLQGVAIGGVWLDLPSTASTSLGQSSAVESIFDLDQAVLDDVHISFAATNPMHAPFVFDLPHVVLSGLTQTGPFHFDATVDNGAPIGLVHSAGRLGPWDFGDPRRTSVGGTFGFHDKTVGIRGLSGKLSLDGQFSGTFAQIQTSGTTIDPDFRLDTSSHAVPMRTSFRFLLDAANGWVQVQSIDAHFLNTHFICSGTATKNRQPTGYNLDFALAVPKGRVEDALALGTRTVPPVLRGALTMQGRMLVPAGPVSVSHKLQLKNVRFHVADATFSSAAVQGRVNGMNERAGGNPKQANAQQASASTAQVDGNVRLNNGVMHFGGVQVHAPGAQIALSGKYSLDGTTFQFDGTVHTRAEASHMTTGVTSVLVKPFNRLFSHGHSGTTMPIRIHGSGGIPYFDVKLPGGKSMRAQ